MFALPHTHTLAQAVGGRAAGTSARPKEEEGGLRVWLKPDWPNGKFASAATTGLLATSASAAPSGPETHTPPVNRIMKLLLMFIQRF